MDSHDIHELNSTPDKTCSYCGESRPKCIVQCCECNRWFCNGANGKSNTSHLITHLVLRKHRSIKLHPDSNLQDTPIECYKCGRTNVFNLGFVAGKQQSVVVLLCRIPCSQEKSPDWDTDNWQPLVEDRHLLPWVTEVPTKDEMLLNEQVSVQDIRTLEAKWKEHQEATILDIDSDPSEDEEEIEHLPERFEDVREYQQLFGKLVALEAKFDRESMESQTLENISISWKVQRKRTLATFSFGSFEFYGPHIGQGDKVSLEYSGPELPLPWKGRGTIIVSPSATNDQITLDMDTREPIPMHVTTGFTADIEWSGISYDRMQDSLKRFGHGKIRVPKVIYQQLLGIPVPLGALKPGARPAGLNDSQFRAFQAAISNPLTLIQGPPGTGKTVTSAAIITQLCNGTSKSKVLVCAPSNVAVDHLALKLKEAGLRVVRLMASSREVGDPKIVGLTLDKLVWKKSNAKLRETIKKKAEHPGSLSDAEERQYWKEYSAVTTAVLNGAQAVCCTCISAGNNFLRSTRFEAVLIDESTQASEPETLVPIAKGCKNLILVGDHRQLGPVISCNKARDAGLDMSLFGRLVSNGFTPSRLEVQYRMHPSLSEFPSNTFYEGSLQNGVTASERTWLGSTFPWPSVSPTMFWSINGHEEISGSTTSYLNRAEATAVLSAVNRLLKDGVETSSIGIITPYEGQRTYLSNYLPLSSSGDTDGIEVASVDEFQGREKDYIIFSCVRANDQRAIGFLRDPRRLNVAITRAKYGLIILGNAAKLTKNTLWHDLILHYSSKECLVEGELDNLKPFRLQLRSEKPIVRRIRREPPIQLEPSTEKQRQTMPELTSALAQFSF